MTGVQHSSKADIST